MTYTNTFKNWLDFFLPLRAFAEEHSLFLVEQTNINQDFEKLSNRWGQFLQILHQNEAALQMRNEMVATNSTYKTTNQEGDEERTAEEVSDAKLLPSKKQQPQFQSKVPLDFRHWIVVLLSTDIKRCVEQSPLSIAFIKRYRRTLQNVGQPWFSSFIPEAHLLGVLPFSKRSLEGKLSFKLHLLAVSAHL